jgi:hydroxyacylglutathione hydrolase
MDSVAPVDEVRCLKLGVTNCYLLSCEGGYLLVDTSYPGMYRSFLRKLRRMGIDISEIKYLLLTHHHDDHAGFAAELVRNTGARVLVHRKGLPFLQKGEAENTSRGVNQCVSVLFWLFALVHKYTYPPLVLAQDDHIIDGDDFSLLKRIGIDGVILHTPGHTEDSISVLLSDGRAIVGDAAMDFMSICRTRHRPVVLQDGDEVYRSWKKLADHGARVIHPAHGKPFGIEELAPYGGKRK